MRRIVLLLASGALAVLLSAGAALAVAPGAVLDAHTTSYDYAGNACGGQPNLRLVQTFEAQNTGLLSDAQARIYGFPETTGDVTAEIITIPTPDNPSQVLGEASIPASSVGVGVFVGDDWENSPMVNFSFAEGVPVTAGQSYGLRISNNVCWILADYTTAQDLDAYPDGKLGINPGAVSSSTIDGVFAIYVVPTNGPDADGDGVLDVTDNCKDKANADQADADGDGIGDVCDTTDDTTAPRVSAVTPTGTGIARGTNVTATFSEDVKNVDATTFKLEKVAVSKKGVETTSPAAATVTPASGTVAQGASATLNPSKDLQRGSTYRATLTNGVTDTAGNALGAPYTWTFKVSR